MYRLAQNHIDLFKQIPFQKFSANVDFINNVITNPKKYATYENILKVYYFIADEIWDELNNKPLVKYNKNNCIYYFYDFIKKRTEILKSHRFKSTKLFNGVLDKDGKNRHFKKYHGLIIKNKPGINKKDVKKLKDEFLQYSFQYKGNLQFFKQNKFELPNEWVEHLYIILNQLVEKAVFFYKQRGSVILAEEMSNFLSNQYLVAYSLKLIKYGEDKEKIMRQIKERKKFMFGELKHDEERFHKIKAIYARKQQQNIR